MHSSSEDDMLVVQQKKRRAVAHISDSEEEGITAGENIGNRTPSNEDVGQHSKAQQRKYSAEKVNSSPCPEGKEEEEDAVELLGRRLVRGRRWPEYLVRKKNGEGQWISSDIVEEKCSQVQIARYFEKEKAVVGCSSTAEMTLSGGGTPSPPLTAKRRTRGAAKKRNHGPRRQAGGGGGGSGGGDGDGSDGGGGGSPAAATPPAVARRRRRSAAKFVRDSRRSGDEASDSEMDDFIVDDNEEMDEEEEEEEDQEEEEEGPSEHEEAGSNSSEEELYPASNRKKTRAAATRGGAAAAPSRPPRRRAAAAAARAPEGRAARRRRRGGRKGEMGDFLVDDDEVEYEDSSPEKQPRKKKQKNTAKKKGSSSKKSTAQSENDSENDSHDAEGNGNDLSFYRRYDVEAEEEEEEEGGGGGGDLLGGLFTQAADDGQETFRAYLRYLALSGSDPDFLNDFWSRKPRNKDAQHLEMRRAVQKIEAEMSTKRESLAGGTWVAGFLEMLQFYPNYQYKIIEESDYWEQKCNACNRTGRVETQFEVRLYGRRYRGNAKRAWERTDWRRRVFPPPPGGAAAAAAAGEDEDEEDGDGQEGGEIQYRDAEVYHLGNQCRNKTFVYHRMLHYKRRLAGEVDKLVHEHSSSVDSALDDDEKVTELFHKFESIKGFTARWIGKNEVPDGVVDRLSAMEDPNQTGLDRYFGQQIRRRRGRNNARRSCSEDEDSASTASNVD